MLLSLVSAVAFLGFIKFHDRIKFKKRILELLVEINIEEKEFLELNKKPFYEGMRYQSNNHNYAHDLDIFGQESLYHHINRCFTYVGQSVLANYLKETILENAKIITRQNAVKELQKKVDWRQKFEALARVNHDQKRHYDFVLKWAKEKPLVLSKKINVLSYVMPMVFFSLIAYTIFHGAQHLISFVGLLLVLNMAILGTQFKKIKDTLKGSEQIAQILKQYALLLKHTETERFKSELLINLQQRLLKNSINAQVQFKQLSNLFSDMDSIYNLMASIFFNGSCLYHLHKFKALNKWKENYSDHISNWLNVIGEMETLNSLANFSYNNLDYFFPTLNDRHQISFENLGHPLLQQSVRVDNSVHFNDHRFIILTGSNMSGKSTFLRALGINLILTQMGAPVCATNAHVHAMKVLVSMRAEDSLAENESYFFAEVKRLKFLMDQSKKQPCFVLLDEILRGTNSDDKRSGTIRYIKKLQNQQAMGAIATHDLEVCRTTDEYPDYLTNKCFEVEIVNENLHFDYKLKEGICQNQSATFLMNKMGII